MTITFRRGLAASLFLTLLGLSTACVPPVENATSADAETFVADAEARLLEAWIAAERAAWVQSTYITSDTEILAAEADRKVTQLAVELAQEATRFDGLDIDADVARKLELLKLSLTLPAPSDAALTKELSQITASLKSQYGSGEYCPEGGECRDLGELSEALATGDDPAEMLEAWTGWRTVSMPMKDEFERYVELGNQGAKELGYADLGSYWRSKYDMDPDAFAAEIDRLWEQMKPFYDALHCHVRAELAERYGEDVVDPSGPIPAHLLGNMWAQSWGNVHDLVAPETGGTGYDLTALLEEKDVDEIEMVKIGEKFFTSLGFAPLPETFWERSLFVKPEDRDVVCHASAWDIDWQDDLRIKMCIKRDGEDFQTIHHELGHNFYQRAYNQLSPLYQQSANDGFHEAVGDTVSLSVTPSYLVQIDFLDTEPDASSDVDFLLRQALDKIAFLPFGLLVDQWRFKVFSGEIPPAKYNSGWWELREKYQGVAPPGERPAEAFDPGAKYHVSANVPYTRYFLAHILQFQFHRSLCEIAGFEGPLHRCSIYGNAEAGERLAAMLEMGISKPWPDALEALTGQREMDATAIVDYFAPLKEWLDEQNAGRTCGW